MMTIKSYGQQSEVHDENGGVLFVGSENACMNYCDERQQIDVDEQGNPITRVILERYFDMAKDSENWKNPIRATFVAVSEHTRLMISKAIEFYTGSKAEWKNEGEHWTVTAKGYYLTCGA